MSGKKNIFLTPEEQRLGMGTAITRRDFLGGSLAGAGAALLSHPRQAYGEPADDKSLFQIDPSDAMAFNGPPGFGDYNLSNGNVWSVVNAAHRIRDGKYPDTVLRLAHKTNELYDLVIVGGGAAGIGGAFYFARETRGKKRCLILDNHPIFGGEAKQNEFVVSGTHLIAPQGSNLLFMKREASDDYLHQELEEIGFPRDFEYQKLSGTSEPLEFDRSNFLFPWIAPVSDSIGLFCDGEAFGGARRWIRNPWKNRLEGAGLPTALREALLRWRFDIKLPRPDGPDTDRWLDSMTYREYLMQQHGLPAAVSDFTEPFVASAVGLGSSVVSAYTAVKKIYMPGYHGSADVLELRSIPHHDPAVHCFPGGNSGVFRAFLKHLRPDAISGGADFNSVVTGAVDFTRLDYGDSPTRIRLNSTVVHVKHVGPNMPVELIYERGGRLYSLRARRVLMANGGWVNKHIIADLPDPHREAYERFKYSSVLVANVALTNWRFLERLGITSCVYTGGEFGASCNIRQPMTLERYKPPLDPSKPQVLTFYATFTYPTESAAAQGARGRTELLTTPYREFERRIRSQMVKLFSGSGFDPARDIAGITINRWGHAYVVPEPGFDFGESRPANALRQRYGNISFAAAELRGLQNFRGAVYEAKRAIEQLLA